MTSLRKLADKLAPQVNLSSAYLQQIMRSAYPTDWIDRPGHRFAITDEAAATSYILSQVGREISQPKINWVMVGNYALNLDQIPVIQHHSAGIFIYDGTDEVIKINEREVPEIHAFWQWFQSRTNNIPSGE